MASWTEPRRPSRVSQAGRLLAELERARVARTEGWVSTRQLLYVVPCIVHSRIAELRKYGYQVEHRTTGPGAAGSEYRLALEEPALHGGSVPLIDGAGSSSATAPQAEATPTASPPGLLEAERTDAVALPDPNQLTLTEVA